MIAGRCVCGTVDTWVNRKPDDHLRCIGLRWCGRCGEAAIYAEECGACRSRRHYNYIRRRMQEPEYRARRNEQSRRWEAKKRRANTAAYLREKERKRLRYRTDPIYAEAKRQAWRINHPRVAA